MKFLHISRDPNLTILSPRMPQEDIINGKLEWGRKSAKPCVCLSLAPIEKLLEAEPLNSGFIYEAIREINTEHGPVLTFVYREIWKEEGVMESSLMQLSKEVRVYSDVAVRRIGSFKMKWDNGIKFEIEMEVK